MIVAPHLYKKLRKKSFDDGGVLRKLSRIETKFRADSIQYNMLLCAWQIKVV